MGPQQAVVQINVTNSLYCLILTAQPVEKARGKETFQSEHHPSYPSSLAVDGDK